MRAFLHVKLTNHFLIAMQDHMPRPDRQWLMEALASGRLLATASDHCEPGRRIAISSGQGYVVCGMEEGVHEGRVTRRSGDSAMLVLLTYLPAARSECLSRRTDTRVVPLSVVGLAVGL